MNKRVLSDLGDYLLAHREEIVGEWLRAVEQDSDISSSDYLKDKEALRDHLPGLCRNLAELLKSPQSNQTRTDVSRAARVHGKYRWLQGYRLGRIRLARVRVLLTAHLGPSASPRWVNTNEIALLRNGGRTKRKVSGKKEI